MGRIRESRKGDSTILSYEVNNEIFVKATSSIDKDGNESIVIENAQNQQIARIIQKPSIFGRLLRVYHILSPENVQIGSFSSLNFIYKKITFKNLKNQVMGIAMGPISVIILYEDFQIDISPASNWHPAIFFFSTVFVILRRQRKSILKKVTHSFINLIIPKKLK